MNNGFELTQNSGIITNSSGDYVLVSRSDLEREREALIQRIQQIHRILGMEPLQTRRQQLKAPCKN